VGRTSVGPFIAVLVLVFTPHDPISKDEAPAAICFIESRPIRGITFGQSTRRVTIGKCEVGSEVNEIVLAARCAGRNVELSERVLFVLGFDGLFSRKPETTSSILFWEGDNCPGHAAHKSVNDGS
jgi:hypothetical protein